MVRPSPTRSAADRRRASSTGRATTVPVDVGGREVWLSIRGVGFAEGTVYAFHDLTEDRRLEQLKADFIATVSHELRTPLAAVHGAAQDACSARTSSSEPRSSRICSTLISEQSDRLAADGRRHPAREQDRLPGAGAGDRARRRRAELAADVIAAARAHAGETAARSSCVAPPSLPRVAGRPRQVAAGPDEPRRERGQVLPGGRSH